MRDPFSSIRRKGRLIAEVRYPAVPKILDEKGEIIECIHPKIRKPLKHWKVLSDGLIFTDDLNLFKQELIITLKRTAVGIEDFGTVQEFIDRTKNYLGLVYDRIGNSISTINRFGVRLIEICAPNNSDEFEDMLGKVVNSFFKSPEDLTINPTDAYFRIVHDKGAYSVGPVKKDESWIDRSFRDPNANVPDIGIGLDIDSYVTEIKIKNKNDLIEAFIRVFELTKAIEESLLRHQGLSE